MTNLNSLTKYFMLKRLWRILLLLFPVAIAAPAVAQWNANPAINTAVCVQPYHQQDVHLVGDNQGGAIAVWTDFRNDPTQASGDIFVQRMNRDGYMLWTANGISLCTLAGDQTAPAITEDGEGGAIAAWTDRRNGNRDIYAQKIDSSGIVKWTLNGAAVAVKANTQQGVDIVSDAEGGAIVVWEEKIEEW